MNRPALQSSLLAVAFALAPSPAMAQAARPVASGSGAACATPAVLIGATSNAAASSPLQRRVSFRAAGLALPDALEQLATASGIRLSWSRELLPVNRTVCVDATRVTIGDLLAHLLRGSDLEPVTAGSAHVVLRRRVATQPVGPTARADSAPRVQELPSVTVSAVTGASERARAAASVTTIEGDALVAHDVRSLRGMLGGAAPGVWTWDQPASAFLAQYGSLRGASSFGASSPKTYIDGVEVANPLLVTMLDPEHIARVEVIRGPQGAALYGADALSGVVNITTRREGAADGAIDLRVRSSGGVVESRYATSAQVAQSHSVTLRAGSSARSFTLTAAGEESGSYLPGLGSRQLNALATGQRVGSRTVLGLTARLATANANAPTNPFLAAANGPGDSAATSIVRSSLEQYTLGFTTRVLPIGRWSHAFAAGIDGYRLSERAAGSDAPLADVPTGEIPAGADRISMRASSVYRVSDTEHASTTLTFGAEHALLRQRAELPAAVAAAPFEESRPRPRDTLRSLIESHGNTGVSTQLDVALREHVFLTGGLRMERLASGATAPRFVALPMLGAGIVGSRDGATLTLRGAYGRGIRAPRSGELMLAGRTGQRMDLRRDQLLPEEQEGTEASAKLAFGQSFSVQVTRFDQLASGLVQRVPLDASGGRRIEHLQNVGEIINRGWEIEQSLAIRALSVSSTLSITDSRVRSVADDGYEGELRAGDRMLEVPALTAGVNVGYTLRRASLSVGMTHARDWMGYDMLALQADGSASGAALRAYWRRYSSVTGLRASVSRDIRRGLRLVVTGDNLLDVQRGAPDNATVLPGRTTTLTLRALF